MKVNFVGGTGEVGSVNADSTRTINWVPEASQSGKENVYLYPTEGLSTFATLSQSGKVKGVYAIDSSSSFLFVIAGNNFYKLDLTGADAITPIAMGTVNDNVTWSNNGTEIAICDGTKLWVYVIATNTMWLGVTGTPTGNQFQVPFSYPGSVTFLSGRFVVNDYITSRIYVSEQYDGKSWDSLKFATAERNPDTLWRVEAYSGTLFLLGDKTTEQWYDVGNADYPFQPISNAFIEYGIAGIWSLAKVGGTLMWATRSINGWLSIVMTTGSDSKIVSTPAIERLINNYITTADLATFSNSFAYGFSYNGHSYYVLTIKRGLVGTDDLTIVFDTTTGLWHERASGATYKNAWRAGPYAINWNRRIILGDIVTNKLYAASDSVYTEGGDNITRTRVTQHFSEEEKHILWHSLQVDFEEGNSATVDLSWSDDGGTTYNTPTSLSLGTSKSARVLLRRLGKSRDRVFKITSTSDKKVVIIGASARTSLCDY